MALSKKELRERWKTEDGKKRLAAVVEALQKKENWEYLLNGFPGVEEVENRKDLRGVNLRSAHLENARLWDTDLRDASLSEVNLDGADLRKANLSGAYIWFAFFRGANLSHANLTGTDFNGTDLSNANLRSARLHSAELTEVCLDCANLQRAELEYANLRNAHLESADLNMANFQGANLGGASIQRANLTEAKLQSAYLRLANLSGANLSNANLGDADLMGASLERANLQGVNFDGASLFETHFEYANLTNTCLEEVMLRKSHLDGTNLSRAQLKGADLSGAQLRGADLSQAHLEGANFERAKLEGTILRACYIGEAGFIWCSVDEFTDLRYSNLDTALFESTIKNKLKYNIRRLNWQDWYREHKLVQWPLRFFWWLSEYGTSEKNLFKAFLGFATIFAGLYYKFPFLIKGLAVLDGEPTKAWVPLRAFYFSVVTMTTLGFGDIYASPDSNWGHVLLTIQVILGYVLLGALITRLGILYQSEGPTGIQRDLPGVKWWRKRRAKKAK